MKKDTKSFVKMGLLLGGSLGLSVLTGGVSLAFTPPILSALAKSVIELAQNLVPEFLGELLEDGLEDAAFDKLNQKLQLELRKQDGLSGQDLKGVAIKKVVFKEIFAEMGENLRGNAFENLIKKVRSESGIRKQNIKKAIKYVVDAIDDYRFEEVIKGKLKNSKAYGNLSEKEKGAFTDYLNYIQNETLYKKSQELEGEERVMLAIIETLIKKAQVGIVSDIKEALIGYIGQVRASGGAVESVRLETVSLKILPHECPNCGYYGPHLYFSENDAKVYCAACGQTYTFLKDIEGADAILKELRKNNKLDEEIAEKMLTKELLEASLKNYKSGLETILMEHGREIEDSIKQKYGQLSQKIDEQTKMIAYIDDDIKLASQSIRLMEQNFDNINRKQDLDLDIVTENNNILKAMFYMMETWTKSKNVAQAGQPFEGQLGKIIEINNNKYFIFKENKMLALFAVKTNAPYPGTVEEGDQGRARYQQVDDLGLLGVERAEKDYFTNMGGWCIKEAGLLEPNEYLELQKAYPKAMKAFKGWLNSGFYVNDKGERYKHRTLNEYQRNQNKTIMPVYTISRR